MQTSNIADLQHKTEKVALFMLRYGHCCIAMKDFTKSIELHSNAISLMKSIFGHEAGNYQVYGICHHNFGVALQKLNRFDEAKQKFEETLNIYESVKTWVNDEKKMNEVFRTTRELHKTNSKLQS